MKSILEYASIYAEDFELSVTPVDGKKPMLKGWQKIHGTASLAERYEDEWLHATGLGMLCGEPSGIIVLDIDILKSDATLQPVLEEIKANLPPVMLGRIGNPQKPAAIFYKYNGEVSRKWLNIKVELLSTGNQCLLPPSTHPDTGDRYKWADKRISQVDLDQLPDLPPSIIKLLDQLNDKHKPQRQADGTFKHTTALQPGVGRCHHGSHNLISAFAVAKLRAQKPKADIIQAVISYDKKINHDADSLYFLCKSRRWRSKDINKNAEAFVNQMFKNPERIKELRARPTSREDAPSAEPGDNFDFRWEDDKGKTHLSNKQSDFIQLFEFMFPDARKDYFNNTVFTRDGKSWKPIENELRVIRAEARICGLQHSLTEDSLYKWMSSIKPRLLIDIPAWDGKDHIGEVLSYISVSNVSHEQFVELFKAWLAGVFKRVYKPEFHNQCVILKGKQGIGKDMFLGNIFKALNDYYSEVIIQPRQKDNYESIEPLMVSYLPEFDESSRIPISTIKAFISASKATFRGAYDRKASSHTFRHSVVSSANFDNILRDPTGNRRFWIFEVENIDWQYNSVLNSGQFIAQAFHLYKEGFQPGKDAVTKMGEYIADATPMSNEELFMEDFSGWFGDLMEGITDGIYSDDIKFSKKFPEDKKIRWEMISEKVTRIARRYGYAPKTAQSIIKKHGFSDVDRKSTYYVIPKDVVKH